MATLTQENKDMVATLQCFIGTVNADGTPNVAPKRSTRVFNDSSLIFTEGTEGATYANIKRGLKVAISIVNRQILDGYRFFGNPSVHEDGDLYEQTVAMSQKAGMPKPRAIIVVNITEIHSLKLGPTAGKKIA
jgi:predicted pyridoxine 5'-phosphate oxidase superfamily flavin-nucleotide-binding protein